MKIALRLLLTLTFGFALFITGLFIGRNQNPAPVQIQAIPFATVAPAPPASEAAETQNTTPTEPPIININTATSEQLQTLPSIGPVIAERIITYRNEHGSFASTTALLNVSGIGEKTLETIFDLVTTGG